MSDLEFPRLAIFLFNDNGLDYFNDLILSSHSSKKRLLLICSNQSTSVSGVTLSFGENKVSDGPLDYLSFRLGVKTKTVNVLQKTERYFTL